jgi:hypothetical protein
LDTISQDAAVAAIAVHHYGVITRQEAASVGLTKRQIEHRVRTGRWQTLRQGVYLIGGVPPTWEQSLYAAVVAAGTTAVASHATSARASGLILPLEDDPGFEISVPWPVHPKLRGVRVHRPKVIDPLDVTRVGAIPATSVALTLVDLSNRYTEYGLKAAVDDALRRHLVRLPHLRACVERIKDWRGARGLGAMEELLARRGPGFHPGDSQSEVRIAELLVAAGLPAPVQQHVVVVNGEKFRLDLAYPPLKIDIEYLGYPPHAGETAFHRDHDRATELRLAGWLVIEITYETTDAQIISKVRRAIELRVAGRSRHL